ncbi:MAG: ABC transporter permease, partial [Planctomycetes bacterium]|nr:ABC transporter permease [Planctomycetota bacterium]
PIVTIFMLACGALLWIVVTQTRFGRHLYAIGGNEESARLSGIRVKLNKIAAYAICGLTCGLAGICQTARDHLGDPEAGFTFELKAIAAVVIGGTSLMGGRGGVALTFLGVLIIGYIEKILSINNVQEPGRLLIQGLIIVIAVIIQRRRA